MQEEMERLNKLVDWYKFKLDEIREAPVDSSPRKLEKLYQGSERNKDSRVTITAGCKPYNQLDYFRQIIRAYQGRDEDAVKYVKKVKELIDKPLDEMIELEDVSLAMAEVKCPHKLDISVFYQLTRRLPHEDLNYDDERLLIHVYDTFYKESIKLLGHTVRCRVNVLYHLMAKISKEPNADLFQFMKEASHQRTEEEIELVF